MAFWTRHRIPYVNFHELNEDWIIEKVFEYVEKTDKMEINFNDLKTYVMNYFDNLDVQNEINNKLDEMYELGQLSDIIQEYLQVSSLLTYNTIADLKNAENLIDGVDALTLGSIDYLDGNSSYFKIRTITSSDVVDEIKIFALTNYPTLIAEKIPYNIDIDVDYNDALLNILEYNVVDFTRNYNQDCAVYENIMIEGGANGEYKVFDLTNNQIIHNGLFPNNIKPHCNAMIFGTKYLDSDILPLLYVTGYNGYDENGEQLGWGVCYVLRFNDDYTCNIQQKIQINFTSSTTWAENPTQFSQTNIIRYGNFLPYENNLYVLNNSIHNNKPTTRIFKFNIPSRSTYSVQLNENDIIEYKDIPFYPIPQGCDIDNEFIYLLSGNNTTLSDSAFLTLIDRQTYKPLSHIPLSQIMNEPEAIYIKDGKIYISETSDFYEILKPTYFGNIGNMNDIEIYNDGTIVSGLNNIYRRLYDKDNYYASTFIGLIPTRTSNNLQTEIENCWDAMCEKIIDSLQYQGTIVSFNAVFNFIGQNGYSAKGFFKVDGIINITNKAGSITYYQYTNNNVIYKTSRTAGGVYDHKQLTLSSIT